MEKEQEKITLSDEEVKKIVDSIDEVDAVDDFDPADLLGLAMELYVQDSEFDVKTDEHIAEIDEIQEPDTEKPTNVVEEKAETEEDKNTVISEPGDKTEQKEEEEKEEEVEEVVIVEEEEVVEEEEEIEEEEEEEEDDDYFLAAMDLFESPEEEDEEPEEEKDIIQQSPVVEVYARIEEEGPTLETVPPQIPEKTIIPDPVDSISKQATRDVHQGSSKTNLQLGIVKEYTSLETVSPIEETLTAKTETKDSTPEKEIAKDDEVGSSLVFLSPEMLKAIEDTKVKPPEETVEEVKIPEEIIEEVKPPVEEELEAEIEIEKDKETEVEEEEAAVEAAEESEIKMEVGPKKEILSPDDWMAIMEGKEVGMSIEDSPAAIEDLGYMLKEETNYKERHVLPERQAPKEVEKPPPRKGLRKKEIFLQTKLAFKQRFGGAVKSPGKICSACGKGEKAKECALCGGSDASIMTRLCEKCANDKKTVNNCISCGRPNAKILAKLCDKCGTRAMSCIKCGAKF
ncbi:MAG: hypothetical protein K8T10_07170 [Candidatus Eremiobacteraeota bacterium]|nr:hypothetical protein [Candidatus Eremiobacteraeota bacterium]